MKKIKKLFFAGCFEIENFKHSDSRGDFHKTWHLPTIENWNLQFNIREIFWSTSSKGDIRGMHFQSPPNCHKKIVTCVSGKIHDVILDLRQDSSTFGHAISVELSDTKSNALYIPEGVAHGFQAQTNCSTVMYLTSREHFTDCDHGVHWNSFGHDWPRVANEISDRDKSHPKLSDFKSPF